MRKFTILIISIFLLGCSERDNSLLPKHRFEKTYEESNQGVWFSVYTDNQTGAEYLLVYAGVSISMVKLEKEKLDIDRHIFEGMDFEKKATK